MTIRTSLKIEQMQEIPTNTTNYHKQKTWNILNKYINYKGQLKYKRCNELEQRSNSENRTSTRDTRNTTNYNNMDIRTPREHERIHKIQEIEGIIINKIIRTH